MYTMKEVCTEVGMSYEALKFYCNQGLIPNVKRDQNNRRIFDERDVNWIKSLTCLKNCGMTIQEMKEYLSLCLEGQKSIPDRQEVLNQHRAHLIEKMQEIKANIDYIDWKLNFYQEVLEGKTPYVSNLIPVEEENHYN